ncbi:peroxisomal N(1)-acetyl-spermine/spermidine oxidase-like [Palaemon carinicauda]|uniref:peroxisomal N(1)-acetyl-spermine/spermidine oxidase-like n=1 Tax=Palaemon carinicauda TaxID=392227 RepID=UPI0035B5CD9D
MKLGKGTLLLGQLIPLLSLFARAEPAHVCDGISGDYDTWKSAAISNHKVIVVGAGIAGLSATKKLIQSGMNNVLRLEAQDYLGGRVKTYRQGSILVEEGAEWIHGGSKNPLYVLADRLDGLTQPLPDEAYDWRAKTQSGQNADEDGYLAAERVMEKCDTGDLLANYYDAGYGDCFIDQFPRVYQNYGADPAEKDAWFHYLHKWVLQETGLSDWRNQSGRDADHFTDLGIDNQWADGYDTLTNHIKKSIPDAKIKMSSPVCKIFWKSRSSRRAVVVTAAQEAYTADYVLVTASIGHLKERHDKLFSPLLPSSYRQHFNKIELGIVDKVQIGWNTPWWSADPLDLQVIFTQMSLPTNEAWLYGIMEYSSIHQQTPIIQAFVSGNDALHMESLTDAEVQDHVVRFLQAVTKQTVPPPTFFRRSKWHENIWMRGSYYSFVTVEGDQQGLKSRAPLRKPIVNHFGKVIFWAGEHTHNTRYGTVDGAMKSGNIAANAIKNYDSSRP